jgi:transcriptional regulator with XRE-family HTH domain
MARSKKKEAGMYDASEMCCRAVPRTAASALRRLGQNIGDARIQKGDSIEQMANRCFTTPMVITELENGNPYTPIGVLASVLFMICRDHELALVCHPGGAALDGLREKAQRSIEDFQKSMKEFVDMCGGAK